MSGWDFENGNKTKLEFTKFPVGITRVRVIGEPIQRWIHYLPQFKRSINCPGKGCPICDIRKSQKANSEKYTYGVSKRLAVNIINRETNNVEVMEQGVTFFQDLRDVRQDIMFDKKGNPTGKTLLDVDIKVRRRGTGVDDTSYRLDIDEETPLSNSDLEKVANQTDLNEYFKPHTIEQITRIVNGETWDEVMKANQNENETEEDVVIA